MFNDPPLTDAQVQAGALPGETWEEARDRLFLERIGDPDWTAADDAPAELMLPIDPHQSSEAQEGQWQQVSSFWTLSPRAQFDHWLLAQGHVRPTAPPFDCPSLESLIAEGFVWHACATRLPHEDGRGRLAYLVSVDYDTWLTLCRYAPMGWECVSDKSLISGVTHWRIAGADEQCSREAIPEEIRMLRALGYP